MRARQLVDDKAEMAVRCARERVKTKLRIKTKYDYAKKLRSLRVSTGDSSW
jgi:NH3-dependent NAD+ synthetase